MRKSIKVLLIIASSLVGIGIMCLCLAVAFGGTDVFVKKDVNYDVHIMSATFDEVDVVNIKDVSNDIQIVKSENDQVKVTYGVSEKSSYYLKQIDNTLFVEYNDLRHWYDHISIFGFGYFIEPDLTIELPEKTLQELNVKTTSGDINANSVDSLVTILKSTSGSIEVGGKVGDLTATSTSGSVKLSEDTQADMAVVSSTSGKIEISGNVKGDVIADNTSGGIVLTDLKCENVDAKTTSGKIKGENLELTSLKGDSLSGGIELNDAVCTEDMNLESTSGSIKIYSVDAENYDLNTTSGSIKARILTSKLYNAKSTSGSVKTPDLDVNAKGVLNAKATSGSVKIELAN